MADNREQLSEAEFAKRLTVYTKDVKNSLVLKQNDMRMLQTAPYVISTLGAMKLLSFAEHAATIAVDPPPGENGFKHLKRRKLPACLVQVFNAGELSFQQAERGLLEVCQRAEDLFGANGEASKIILCLLDPTLAKKTLVRSMDAMRDNVDKCIDLTTGIEQAFATWQEMVRELSEAAAGELSSTADMTEETVQEMRRANEDKAESEKRSQLYEKTMDGLLKDLELARSGYDYVAQRQSSTRDILPVAFMATLGTIQNTVNATLDVAKAVPNAALGVSAAVGRFDPGLAAPAQATQPATPAEQPTPPPQRYPDANDPAYQYAATLLELIQNLYDLIASPDRLRQTGKDSIPHFESKLSSLQDYVGGNNSQPGLKASSIIHGTQKVIVDVYAALNELQNLKSPGKSWREKVDRCRARLWEIKTEAIALQTAATQQPGHAFGTEPPVLPDLMAPMHAGTGVGALLENARAERQARTLRAQKTLLAVQANHQKATERFIQDQAKGARLAEQLSNAASKKNALDETLKVLREAISIVTRLHSEIGHLTSYFVNIRIVVDSMGRRANKAFLDPIQDINDARAGNRGRIKYSHRQAEMILTELCVLRGHFSLIQDSARFYSDVSRDHIMPAFRQVNSVAFDADRSEAIKELHQAAAQTAAVICEKAEKNHERLVAELVPRIREMSEESEEAGMLESALPIETQRAITQAVDEVQQTAGAIIENENFAIFDDDMFGAGT